MVLRSEPEPDRAEVRPEPERLAALERTVGELSTALRRVEERLAGLEAGRPPAEEPEAIGRGEAAAPLAPAAVSLSGLVTLAGRTFLVLGGAYLIRAFTDAGAVPRLLGVGLGLAYALTWVLAADRAGRRGQASSATFHGLAAVAIAYPLVWESATRFAVLRPVGAALALSVVTTLLLAVAVRQTLPILAWATTLASLAAAVAFLAATHAIEALSALLLLLAWASLGLARARGWSALRWPVAAVADAVIFGMTALATREGGPPESYGDLSIPGVLVCALGLPLLYGASFALDTLVHGRRAGAFEVLQTAAGLLVGLGGTAQVMASTGLSPVPLGSTMLLLGAAGYAAMAMAERASGAWSSALFHGTQALVLTLWGSELALGAGAAVLVSFLGFAAAVVGVRFDRMALRAHAVACLAAAALASGLAAAAAGALLAPAPSALPAPTATAIFVLSWTVAAYLMMALSREASQSVPARLPARILGLLALAGLATLAIRLVAGGSPDPAVLALARTVALATAALAIAPSRSLRPVSDIAWLVHPLLFAGGIELVVDGLPHGRPATLFLAFAVYGLALILAPRLLRREEGGVVTAG